MGLCNLSIGAMMRCIDLNATIVGSSQMNANISTSDLVLNLCLGIGTISYFFCVGDENYLNSEVFHNAGVGIVCKSSVLTKAYRQLSPQAEFINHLPALDILLKCGDIWGNYLPAGVVK